MEQCLVTCSVLRSTEDIALMVRKEGVGKEKTRNEGKDDYLRVVVSKQL